MLRAVTQKDLMEIFMGEDSLSDEEKQQVSEWVSRRVQGEPLAHLLGESSFLNMALSVNRETFIPRIETELLVAETLRLCRDGAMGKKKKIRVLELGTGSGNIALGLTRKDVRIHLDTVEILEGTIRTAERNVEKYGSDRVRLIRMDYMKEVWETKLDSEYDIIVSNPPYIPEDDHASLPAEVQREPRLALVSGKRGDENLRHILEQGRRFLPHDGRIVLEMGIGQAPRLVEYLRMFKDLRCEKIINDHQDIERVLTVKRSAK